jgi:hypothetical protein
MAELYLSLEHNTLLLSLAFTSSGRDMNNFSLE